MTTICRTCLKKSTNMHKLCEFINDNLQIESMLKEIVPSYDLGMDVIPLPVEICKECLGKLQTSFDFVQMCLESSKELRNIVNQHELEIEEIKPDIGNWEFLEQTDILMCNIKKEQLDDYNGNYEQPNIVEARYTDLKVKLEDDTEEGHQDDNSSNEYLPDGEKGNIDRILLRKTVKNLLIVEPKKKYRRKVSFKRGSIESCPHCKKLFATKNLLSKHMAVHESSRLFACKFCNYRFSSEGNLKTHVSAKHTTTAAVSLDEGPYFCPECPMSFQQYRALAAHSVKHSKKNFKCQVCSMSLKTLAAVTKHMNTKHPDVLPHKCHLCEKSFPAENHLNDHINEHMGYKKHKCDLCEKSFISRRSLKDHLRIHTGESPFLCSYCGKSFTTAHVLRQHLQRHGEKNFHCAECPMKFYTKINLTQHMTSHTKLKPHVCDICGAAFTRQDTLKAHKFKHTGERPHKCEDCNMSFVFKRHLKRHKMKHTGEKPRKCNFCDRAYVATSDLVKHLRSHVGENTYFCDQCPESFKYSLDLKKHQNLHCEEN